VVLGEVAIHRFVGGKSEANARGDQTVRFARRIFADDGERDLPGLQVLQPLGARNEFAIRRKY
jgi:hypothetical protein